MFTNLIECYSINPYSSLKHCPKCNSMFKLKRPYNDMRCYNYYICTNNNCLFQFHGFDDFNQPINTITKMN